MTRSLARRAFGAAGGVVAILLLARVASAEGLDAPSDSLTDLHGQYARAMQGGLYNEAADATKRYIDVLLSEAEIDESSWGAALARLGEAQLLSGEFDEAIANYALAVEVLEAATNRLDGSLVDPLIGLGRAHEHAGNYLLAIDAYKRGNHVRRVNTGLFTLEQAETLDKMSQIYYRLGEYDEANNIQQAYAGIYAQNYPDDYLKQVPAQLSRAVMLTDTGKYFDGKLAFRRIIDNIESADSRRSLALLPVIYEFADLLQNHHILDDVDGLELAHRFLRRAVHIAQNNDEATPLDRADAYIALGDYYVTGKVNRERAMQFYLRGWEELSDDERYFDARAERFEKPKLLNPAPANMPTAMRRVLMLSNRIDKEKDARLVTKFDIDELGRAHNVEVAEGDPTGYYDPILIRYIELLPFRPGIVDGQPARFENQAHVIEYPSGELYVELGQNSQQSAVD